jgi:hypothetical protein
MSDKKFASHADLEAKKVSFEKLSENAYAYTAEGDPNTGVIIGDDSVMIIDATATPVMAQDVVRYVREITRCACWAPRVTRNTACRTSSPRARRES